MRLEFERVLAITDVLYEKLLYFLVTDSAIKPFLSAVDTVLYLVICEQSRQKFCREETHVNFVSQNCVIKFDTLLNLVCNILYSLKDDFYERN